MAAIYDAIKASGWGVVYYATIEGLPVVWTERALSLSLPSGYTSESATLIVEDSILRMNPSLGFETDPGIFVLAGDIQYIGSTIE